MDKSRKSSFKFSLLRLISIAPLLYRVIKNSIVLLEQDIKLTRQNLFTLLLVIFFLLIIVTSIWICLLSLLFVYLISLKFTVLHAISIILMINLILFIIEVGLIFYIKNNLFFPKTKEILVKLFK